MGVIEEKIAAAIEKDSWRSLDVKITKTGEKEHTISIEQMYEFVKLTFAALHTISEIIGTDKINIANEFGGAGCDTCGHGSSYYVILTVFDAANLT